MQKQETKPCVRCGQCCIRSPCQIPVMHIEALRRILVHEFKKPANIGSLDIVEVLFRYKEEVLEDGRISGYFIPLPNSRERCMWLKREADGKFSCRLFWNKTASQLIDFPEQVVGKGKGCTLANVKSVPIIPMVYRYHRMGLAKSDKS